MRRSFKLILIVLGLIVVLGVGFALWGLNPSKPMTEALNAIRSDDQVSVQTGEWMVFKPLDGQVETGFIIYPGGHVDFRAYAPAAREIAANGYLVAIVPMPLNLAVLNSDAALKVIASYPGIKRWAIGGHSLGGAMAAHFVIQNPGVVDGLILWAAYSASNEDLTNSSIKVLSISGSLDGLSTPEKIDDSRSRLPADTTWVRIAGGNHAQFGWYGEQSGDNPPEISRQEQQDQVVMATLEFLATLRRSDR
jgi:hypothetical protein